MTGSMTNRVVRRLGYDVTHVVHVPTSALCDGTAHGVAYVGIVPPLVAVCGTGLRDRAPVVCMRPGTKVRCRFCARISGIAEAADDNTKAKP